jgi:hypothetical protein
MKLTGKAFVLFLQQLSPAEHTHSDNQGKKEGMVESELGNPQPEGHMEMFRVRTETHVLILSEVFVPLQ